MCPADGTVGPIFSQKEIHFHSTIQDLKILPHIQKGLLESCRERESAKAESFCHSNCILVYVSTVSVPLYLMKAQLSECYFFRERQRYTGSYHCGNKCLCI